VENALHWSLDVCFREDDSRTRKGHAPENLAAIRRAALGLLKNETTFHAGLKRKRRRCAMDWRSAWKSDPDRRGNVTHLGDGVPPAGRRSGMGGASVV
jgi:hypothetical protein